MRQEGDAVVVVGAGIAGLVAARELVLLGHQVRVVEASDRIGGQLEALTLDALAIDGGADRVVPEPALLEYVERLGLTDRVVSSGAGRIGLRAPDAGARSVPEPTWLGIPLAPLAADVVALIGRRAAWRAQLDALLPGPVGARAATLGDLVRRRCGEALLERLVAPIVRSERGVHPDELPLSAVEGLSHHLLRENSLGRAVARVRLDGVVPGQLDRAVCSLDGGLAGLVDALGAELDRFGVPIELGARVETVGPDHVVLADPEALDAASDTVEPDPARVRHGRVLVAAPGLVGAGTADAGRSTTIAVLVVDGAVLRGGFADPAAQELPALRVIATEAAFPGDALDVEIVSARWGPLGRAAGERAVLRVRYPDAPAGHPVDAERARLDASALLGVSIPPGAVRAAAVRTWRTARIVDAEGPIAVTGEQVVGPDLARIVAHARAAARALVPERD